MNITDVNDLALVAECLRRVGDSATRKHPTTALRAHRLYTAIIRENPAAAAPREQWDQRDMVAALEDRIEDLVQQVCDLRNHNTDLSAELASRPSAAVGAAKGAGL